MTVISAFASLGKEDCMFQVSLNYIVRPYLKKQNKTSPPNSKRNKTKN
jgi:hypothetical protein